MLERDPARVQEFRDYFTINVTEFFRDSGPLPLPGDEGAARSCWRSGPA